MHIVLRVYCFEGTDGYNGNVPVFGSNSGFALFGIF